MGNRAPLFVKVVIRLGDQSGAPKSSGGITDMLDLLLMSERRYLRPQRDGEMWLCQMEILELNSSYERMLARSTEGFMFPHERQGVC